MAGYRQSIPGTQLRIATQRRFWISGYLTRRLFIVAIGSYFKRDGLTYSKLRGSSKPRWLEVNILIWSIVSCDEAVITKQSRNFANLSVGCWMGIAHISSCESR
jgi:hypothetical protein